MENDSKSVENVIYKQQEQDQDQVEDEDCLNRILRQDLSILKCGSTITVCYKSACRCENTRIVAATTGIDYTVLQRPMKHTYTVYKSCSCSYSVVQLTGLKAISSFVIDRLRSTSVAATCKKGIAVLMYCCCYFIF